MCDKTCLPELKNTGNKKEANIIGAYLLTPLKSTPKEVYEIIIIVAKKMNNPKYSQKLLNMSTASDTIKTLAIFI